MAEYAAKHLGTILFDTINHSNEAILHEHAVLEDRDSSNNGVHKYSIYKVDFKWFKSEMIPDYKRDYIGQLDCGKIRKHCEKISELTCDF